MAPGPESSLDIRKRVYLMDKYRCVYCNMPFIPSSFRKAPQSLKMRYKKTNVYTRLTVDHIIPDSQGGKFRIYNLVSACGVCNNRRGNMPLNDFLDILAEERKANSVPPPWF